MLIKVVIRLLTSRHIREAYLKQVQEGQFENAWAAKEIARTFLGGEQKRRRKDGGGRMGEGTGGKSPAQSVLNYRLPQSLNLRPLRKEFPSAKSWRVLQDAAVLSPGPDDDDTDWEDIEEEDDSSDVKQVRMVDANEQGQFPANDDQTVDENDQEYFPDNDGDPREFHDHVMIVDEKENRAPSPASPAAARVQTLATPANKIDKGKGRAHAAQVSRAARNKHATETPEAALTWDTLPKTCPSVMCSDALPREPVAKILSLFEKRRAQQKLGDKGVRIIEPEILFALGQRRQWLPGFDPQYLARRLVQDELCNSYVRMILEPHHLASQPIWEEFLLAINYKLVAFEGLQNKRELPALLEHRSCGYDSQLWTSGRVLDHIMPSTITNPLNLEVMLYNTVDNIVAHDEVNFNYNDFASANHISLEDFVDWILVPYAATRLIMEDLGYDNYDNASLERLTSKEYGKLFNPEDDFDEAADAVLRANAREGSARPAPVALPSSSRRTPPVTHQMYAPASVRSRLPLPKPRNRAHATPWLTRANPRQPHVGGSGSRFAASPWLGPKSPPSSAFGDRFVPSSSALNNGRYIFPTTASPFGGPSTSSHRYPHSAPSPMKTEPSGLTTPLLNTSAPPRHRRALAATRPPSVQNTVKTEKSTPQVIEVDDRKQGQDASAVKSTTKTVEVVAGDTGTLKITACPKGCGAEADNAGGLQRARSAKAEGNENKAGKLQRTAEMRKLGARASA
ncbi:hypothetical protein R3P38DRAFT_2806335 [Favolaschia claudopus]|uniref:Restriction of telomere capping protein 4 C-terminal domain-containing protein n=1 Tax=Favolaschia claudopus TaxID=2862362 RepID=A0AAV9ZKK8_9AGAR